MTNASELDSSNPINDKQRLAILEATNLMDSPEDASFNRFTRLARSVLNVPVSLVGEDRQFFKSCVGLTEPWLSNRQTPLSHSFCKHVVCTTEPLIVSDARHHPLLSTNPAIVELNVVAYLGFPLMMSEGLVLGSFCVIDQSPRHWTTAEVNIVKDISALVISEIEFRLLSERLQADYLELRGLELHRDETINALIHDLRNPLTSYLFDLQQMQKDGGLTERQENNLNLAIKGGMVLRNMISEMLASRKRTEANVLLNITNVNPVSLVSETCEELMPLAKKSRVRLKHNGIVVPVVKADKHLLCRILINLISNAIQHTPEYNEVVVSTEK